MIQTAESVLTDPKYYSWSFPGAPVKVQLDLGVIARLQERLQSPAGAAPEQGLLFGRTSGGTTEVSDFQIVADGNLPKIIAALAEEQSDQFLVGYYRTQKEEALRLNQHDLSLAEEFFGKPHHVFLLIQTTGAGPANASFFFRDGGRMNGNFAFLEFPLDVPQLAAQERYKLEAAKEKLLEPPPPAEPPVVPSAAVAHQRRGTVLQGIAWTVLTMILTTAAILLGARLYPEEFTRVSTAIWDVIPVAPGKSATLGLHAEHQGGDLVLSWNRESAPIANATSGEVLIQDGDMRREFPLDPMQLRQGSILYSPATDQVRMQLTIVSPSGAGTESILALLSKTGTASASVPQAGVPVSKVEPAESVDPPVVQDAAPLTAAAR